MGNRAGDQGLGKGPVEIDPLLESALSGFIGFYSGYIRIMEKNMETTI